jgi:VanZ family protein
VRVSRRPFKLPSSVTRWIAPALWAALILTLGTSLFSIVRTSAIFNPLIAQMMPRLDPNAMYQVQVFIRRSAHVLEYAILFLGLSLWPLRGRPLAAFFVCIAVASLDESLQMLRPSRSGTVFDVADDTSGATIIMVLAMPYWERLSHLRRVASSAVKRRLDVTG